MELADNFVQFSVTLLGFCLSGMRYLKGRKQAHAHSRKAEQKSPCMPFSHAQGGNQQRRCHADKNIFHICHARTALPVAGSKANTQPVSRTSNP